MSTHEVATVKGTLLEHVLSHEVESGVSITCTRMYVKCTCGETYKTSLAFQHLDTGNFVFAPEHKCPKS